MVSAAAQPAVEISQLKEEAQKHMSQQQESEVQQPSAHAAPQASSENAANDRQLSGSAGAETNGHGQNGVNGQEHGSGSASPDNALGYSQTGEFVGAGPEQVNANPANPSLPPPNVAKAIPCRFYPSCRYGDSCAFAHGPENFPASLGESVGPGSALFNGPPPTDPMGFFNPYAAYPPTPHGSQPGLPPMDYYGAPVAPGFYGPPPTSAGPNGAYSPPAPYGGGMPYYGYNNFYPPPPPASAAAQPQSNGFQAPASDDSPSQAQQVEQPSNEAAQPSSASASEEQTSKPATISVSPDTPAFVPMSSSAEQSQQHSSSSTSSSRFEGRPLRSSQNMASAPSFGSSMNHGGRRERGGPAASSARTTIKGSSSKKPHQVACTFFNNNSCRLGDACQFSHILTDGTDAKALARNIVGLDGREGDSTVLEEFKRTESLRKERLAATGAPSHRPRTDGLPHPRSLMNNGSSSNGQTQAPGAQPQAAVNGSRFTAPMQQVSGLPGVDGHYHQNGHNVSQGGPAQRHNSGNQHHQGSHSSGPRGGNRSFGASGPRGRSAHQSHGAPASASASAPRLPSGEDFPALPAGVASPRNESPAKGNEAPASSEQAAVAASSASASQPAQQETTEAEHTSAAPPAAEGQGQADAQVSAAARAQETAAAAAVIPKLVSSFASAAARGASAPAPAQPARNTNGRASNTNTNGKNAGKAAAPAAPSSDPTTPSDAPAPPPSAEAVAA